MPLLDSKRSILVLIDLQGKLVSMAHRPARVLETARRLLRLADLFEVPVVLTEQYPKGIGLTEASIRTIYDGLATPRFLLEKSAFGCCADAAFEGLLQQARPGLLAGKRQVVHRRHRGPCLRHADRTRTAGLRPRGARLLGRGQRTG